MCGCKKNVIRQNRTFRPTQSARAVQGGIAAGSSPAQVRAMNAQTATSPTQVQRMDAQRRRIEQIRRAAIKRKMGQ